MIVSNAKHSNIENEQILKRNPDEALLSMSQKKQFSIFQRLLGRLFLTIKNKLYIVPPTILFFLTRIPVKIFFKIFGHLKIEGVENIKNLPKGVIFAANHTSELDPIIMTLIFPILSRHLPLFFISMEKKFYRAFNWKRYIYGGLFFEAWGAYQAYAGLYNYEASLKNHIELLRDKRSICVFPEGKRNFNGKISQAKGGATYLSHRTNMPIVPVLIKGLLHIKFRDLFFRKANIVVKIGKPIYPSELFGGKKDIIISQDYDECRIAAEKVMVKIKNF